MNLNDNLKRIFKELAILHDMKDEFFQARAYEHAVESLSSIGEDVSSIYKKGGLEALKKIPGVGEAIAEKIEQFIKTGRIRHYEKLKKEFPVDVIGLAKLEGIGAKTIKRLYKELGIKNVRELERAVAKGELRSIKGFGKKTEEHIARSIQFLRKLHGRYLIGDILPIARGITDRLKSQSFVSDADYAGSLRRMQETIGDIDIVVASGEPRKVMDFFLSLQDVAKVRLKGITKSTVVLNNGIQTDLRVVPLKSYGAALQYFTGDKYHNIAVREIAIDKGYKLNEYGLYKGKRIIASRTEQEIYKKLGMRWMEPELRTNSGEIEAAMKNTLPRLIDYDDLQGDLQVHTDWTDGSASIEDMAKAACKAGLKYILITDHTKNLAMAHGLDEKRLLKQMAEIDRVQKRVSGIRILKGSEVNILRDGTLDIKNEVLEKLDAVGAAVHTAMRMGRRDMTERIIRAMRNPNVDILFHPTGRRIHLREPFQLDFEELIKVAKKTKTVIEINAHPERLDLNDKHIKAAHKTGIRFSIDSDTHSKQGFDVLEYGIGQARRAWLGKKDVINTRPWKEMLKLLK